MSSTQLHYFLPRTSWKKSSLDDEDFNNFARLNEGIKASKNHIDSWDGMKLRAYFQDSSYVVSLDGQKDLMRDAVEAVVITAGMPDFVSGNYRSIDSVINPMGKRTKRKLFGCFDGKHIIDL